MGYIGGDKALSKSRRSSATRAPPLDAMTAPERLALEACKPRHFPGAPLARPPLDAAHRERRGPRPRSTAAFRAV
jgi:hypothetical protein